MSVEEHVSRPPIDREYASLLDAGDIVTLRTIGREDIASLRRESSSLPIEQIIGDRRIRHEEFVVSASGLPVTVLTPALESPIRACVFAIHGGGMIVGDRHAGLQFTVDWVERLGVAVISPEYRLAPEHPYPAALEDCDNALAWARALLVDRAEECPLVIFGASAGGGLAASLTLRLRDRQETVPAGLLLQAPMLDHRNMSVSARQFSGTGQWDRESNETGWAAYLGAVHPDAVNGTMSPAVATDLSGFPPTFIDVGSAEVFRDEDVAFASALWAAGIEAQLAVWPGGVHGFDRAAPQTHLGHIARAVRDEWLERTIAWASQPR